MLDVSLYAIKIFLLITKRSIVIQLLEHKKFMAVHCIRSAKQWRLVC